MEGLLPRGESEVFGDILLGAHQTSMDFVLCFVLAYNSFYSPLVLRSFFAFVSS